MVVLDVQVRGVQRQRLLERVAPEADRQLLGRDVAAQFGQLREVGLRALVEHERRQRVGLAGLVDAGGQAGAVAAVLDAQHADRVLRDVAPARRSQPGPRRRSHDPGDGDRGQPLVDRGQGAEGTDRLERNRAVVDARPQRLGQPQDRQPVLDALLGRAADALRDAAHGQPAIDQPPKAEGLLDGREVVAGQVLLQRVVQATGVVGGDADVGGDLGVAGRGGGQVAALAGDQPEAVAVVGRGDEDRRQHALALHRRLELREPGRVAAAARVEVLGDDDRRQRNAT